ncbi:hypothetical protein E2C01_044179 [Portunus trituberculatus]|uniref:Uncharacterized protein n=1 Tax=Portunus trituberculatus TaxID=210409 RepID=A0A5B7FSG4_PORTR|nr:hypothetical protein [Portunus trituberculatus]
MGRLVTCGGAGRDVGHVARLFVAPEAVPYLLWGVGVWGVEGGGGGAVLVAVGCVIVVVVVECRVDELPPWPPRQPGARP